MSGAVAQSALVMRPASCHRIGRDPILFMAPSCAYCSGARACGSTWTTTEDSYSCAASVTNHCGHVDSCVRLMRESISNLRLVASGEENQFVAVLAREYATRTHEGHGKYFDKFDAVEVTR
jgi:hypothetical protein